MAFSSSQRATILSKRFDIGLTGLLQQLPLRRRPPHGGQLLIHHRLSFVARTSQAHGPKLARRPPWPAACRPDDLTIRRLRLDRLSRSGKMVVGGVPIISRISKYWNRGALSESLSDRDCQKSALSRGLSATVRSLSRDRCTQEGSGTRTGRGPDVVPPAPTSRGRGITYALTVLILFMTTFFTTTSNEHTLGTSPRTLPPKHVEKNALKKIFD